MRTEKSAWRWANKAGFSVVGTFDPYEAFHLIYSHLDSAYGEDGWMEEEAPTFSEVLMGRRLWITDGKGGYRRWWFGRKKILLIPV